MNESHGTIQFLLNGKITLPLTPDNIATIPLYHVHLNLWDTILSSHGEPAIARLAEVSADQLKYTFEILQDRKFSNGREIVSKDIDFSLNRLMNRQEGGHFGAKEIIKQIECLDKKKFSITITKPTPSFLFLLSIPETGIVPREACDGVGNIVDLKFTSGPYIAENPKSADELILIKNRYFSRALKNSPERIKLNFSFSPEEILSKLQAGQYAFSEIYQQLDLNLFDKAMGLPHFSYKATRPSYSTYLSSTKNDSLTTSNRKAIANLFNKKLNRNYEKNSAFEIVSYELLPPHTFGSLDSRAHMVWSEEDLVLPKKIKLGYRENTSPFYRAIIKTLIDSNIEVDSRQFNFGQNENEFDYVIFGQGMNLDYPEIEFHLNLLSPYSILQATDDEKYLIKKATHSMDQVERSEIFKKISHNLISDARVIPLVVRSYVHLYDKSKVNIDGVTNYDGDIKFWQMSVH